MQRQSRNKKRIRLIFLLVGLVSIALLSSIRISHVAAKSPHQNITPVEKTIALISPEERGKKLYQEGQYIEAIKLWEQAIINYVEKQDYISQARVTSNLALAYYQLGEWEKAQTKIKQSIELLDGQQGISKNRVLAQVLNNQGIIESALGNSSKAISLWEESREIYQKVDDELGVIRSTINSSNTLKSLGLNNRALNAMEKLYKFLQDKPDTELKSIALRNYGELIRDRENITEAKIILQESQDIALKLGLEKEKVRILLALGNTIALERNSKGEFQYAKALELYNQASIACQKTTGCVETPLPLKIKLAQLSVLTETKYWWRGIELIPSIKNKLASLPLNRANLYYPINLAHHLIEINQKENKPLNISTPSWLEINDLLDEVINKSEKLQDQKSLSYALGLQGKIAQQQQQWEKARQLTQQAITISQNLNASEISYLWQWQLGRIDRQIGNIDSAINNYATARESLNSITQDLVTIDPNIQYSFRESVEPIYRESIDLLLQSDSKKIEQEKLIKARDLIESLQIEELHDFFHEACLNAKPVPIDSIDRHAAAIYPIILKDRLEIILSSRKTLLHYSIPIPQEQIQTTIEELSRTIVIRSRRSFYQPAKQLYNWLINPLISELEKNKIKTIVFVPDSNLRNIPLATLYDGEHYLIEKYNIVLNPGLQLLTPRPLKDIPLRTFGVGITEARQGFSSLDFVGLELKEIKNRIKSLVLLNEEFTTESFKQKIKFSDYPIIHIATHGQFSSSLEDTFLLTWDNKIDINQLKTILQTRTPSVEKAIELLVLSACETATGDKRAALGLAGIAVRAGARSTLATLWAVNDEATARLMSQFYQKLVSDRIPKAEAVRKAQLSLLAHPDYRHPFFWASYVLIGNWL